MTLHLSDPARFRKARERAGLSVTEAAFQMTMPEAAVSDLETYPDELTSVYSPAEIQRFAAIFGTRAADLLGVGEVGEAVTPPDLAQLICAHCESNGITIEDFENAAGWAVADNIKEPQRFLDDLSFDGIQDICNELHIDWQRFANAL